MPKGTTMASQKGPQDPSGHCPERRACLRRRKRHPYSQGHTDRVRAGVKASAGPRVGSGLWGHTAKRCGDGGVTGVVACVLYTDGVLYGWCVCPARSGLWDQGARAVACGPVGLGGCRTAQGVF